MIAYMPETLSSLGQKCQGFCGRRGFQEAHIQDLAVASVEAAVSAGLAVTVEV